MQERAALWAAGATSGAFDRGKRTEGDAGKGSGQVLTVVPEGRRRWRPACRALAAAVGLGALLPLVAAVLGGPVLPGSRPTVLARRNGLRAHPGRRLRLLLPQRLLGCHDLLALGDERALLAHAQLPAAVPGVPLDGHHEAVVAAAGALGCPQRLRRGLGRLHGATATAGTPRLAHPVLWAFIRDRGAARHVATRGAGQPMAAGGERPAPRGLPALRLARLPRAPLAGPFGAGGSRAQPRGLSLQELRGARAPRAGTSLCAGARRGGGLGWSRCARTGMRCPLQ